MTRKLRRVLSVVLAVVMLVSLCVVSFGSTAGAAETKTATYSYNFRNYDAYDYMVGTKTSHRVLSYGGTDDYNDKDTTRDFWNNSSGPTPYGMIVGGVTDFFKDTGYNHFNGKMVVRGTYGDDVDYYDAADTAKAVKIKQGYTYNVTIKFVPLNLTHQDKAIKVAIGLVQDNEAQYTRAIGTNYPTAGVYYMDKTPRYYAEWEMDVAKNVYRYSDDLIGAYVGDETPENLASQGIDETWPVHENGLSLTTEPDFVMNKFNNCVQTLTCTYKYGETDFINDAVQEGDLGASFCVMVGSQGASVGSYNTPYLSQIVVTDMTIEVIAPADSTDFNDGDKFHSGEEIAQATFATGEVVDIVDGMVTIPDGADAYVDPATDLAVYPGQKVNAVHGANFKKLTTPVLATGAAWSYREAGIDPTENKMRGSGIRFKGTIKLPSNAHVNAGGGDVGFMIIPAVEGAGVRANWFQLKRDNNGNIVGKFCDKLLVVPVDKNMTYDGAAPVNNANATYQIALTSINEWSESDKNIKFFVGMYTTTNSTTGFTYRYIGCYSYNDVYTALSN